MNQTVRRTTVCHRVIRLALALVLGVSATAATVGCTAYRPRPAPQPAFLARLESETQEPVRVSAAALGAGESVEYFGADLAVRGIQPVWLAIENRGTTTLYLLSSSVDPAYFSPREAAYQVHRMFAAADNQRKDAFFASQHIDDTIPPGATRSGFLFTNRDERAKYVTVKLYGERQTLAFRFVLDFPGIGTDYDRVDFEALYPSSQIVDLEGHPELREALQRLPACTTRRDGSGRGDALNFVLIGSPDEVGGTLVATGWNVTEALGPGAAWRTLKSFALGQRYLHAPMSALYVFGRHHDAGFQKARDSIHQRNHLRLWLTPLRFRGRPVWVGAVSRDIGVYLTPRAWTFTTHAIDPDLDEAREALTEDLVTSQAVRSVGYVRGVETASADRPHHNLMNAPYWTDGGRAVFLFDDAPTSLGDIEFFDWE